MNGKTLKVVEYNLSFGTTARIVHVFGLFRYKPNNNLYVVYADTDAKYNVIYYGSSHIKGNTILAMACKDAKEGEFIKEYIFKVTMKENLDNFEIISLNEVEGLEIITSNKVEVKPEVLYSLIDITIPKPEIMEPVVENIPNKKKSSKKGLLLLIVLLLLGGGGYFYFSTLFPKDTTGKDIVCIKSYQHNTLNATTSEENTYHFNYQDKLESVDSNISYQFLREDDYQDFINNGAIYSYMPDDDTNGGWNIDDNTYLFKVMTKVKVDSSYNEPVQYEEVLSYYKNEGYSCSEKIKKE